MPREITLNANRDYRARLCILIALRNGWMLDVKLLTYYQNP